MLKTTFLLVLINVLGIIPVFAQEQDSGREDLWVCPVFESGFYGVSSIAFGGGAALGYGDRVAYGLKAVYWNDGDTVIALELNFLARYYFFQTAGNSGLFIQFNGGPVIFTEDDNNFARPLMSLISTGLSLGWRILLGGHFFVEPAIRAGYPFVASIGLSAGVHF